MESRTLPSQSGADFSPEQHTALKTRLVLNTLSNALRLFATIGVGLVVPAVMVMRLGMQGYGTWALLTSLSNLVAIADLGLQPAIMKLTADCAEKRDLVGLKRHVGAALYIYICIGAMAVATAWVTRNAIGRIYFRGAPASEPVATLFFVFIFGAAASLVADLFHAVLSGLSRMDRANLIATVAMLMQACGFVAVVSSGYGIAGLAAVTVLATLGRGAWTFVAIRRIERAITLQPVRPDADELRSLLHLGSSGIAVRISGITTSQINRLLMATAGGVAYVGYYDLASRVVGQFSAVGSIMFSPLIPHVAQLASAGRRELISVLTQRCWKYLNVAAQPAYWLTLVMSPFFVRAWLGSHFEVVSVTVQLLATAHFINLLSGPAYHTLIGVGKPRLCIEASIIAAVGFIVVAVLTVSRFGYWGVIASECAGVSAGGVFLTAMFHRQEGISFRTSFWQPMRGPLAVSATVAAALAYALRIIPAETGLTLVQVAATGAVYALAVFVGLILIGTIGPYERHILAGLASSERRATSLEGL